MPGTQLTHLPMNVHTTRPACRVIVAPTNLFAGPNVSPFQYSFSQRILRLFVSITPRYATYAAPLYGDEGKNSRRSSQSLLRRPETALVRWQIPRAESIDLPDASPVGSRLYAFCSYSSMITITSAPSATPRKSRNLILDKSSSESLGCPPR